MLTIDFPVSKNAVEKNKLAIIKFYHKVLKYNEEKKGKRFHLFPLSGFKARMMRIDSVEILTLWKNQRRMKRISKKNSEEKQKIVEFNEMLRAERKYGCTISL